jgi:hypothetical protein
MEERIARLQRIARTAAVSSTSSGRWSLQMPKKEPEANILFSDNHITVEQLADGEVICYRNVIGVEEAPRLEDAEALDQIGKRERFYSLQLERLRNVKTALTIFWAKRHMGEDKS